MRFRKLSIAWSVTWGTVALLACVLWVRSYSAFDRISGRIGRKSSVTVSHAGRLTTVVTRLSVTRAPWPQWDSGPILPNKPMYDRFSGELSWSGTDVVWPKPDFMGFGILHRSMYPNMPNNRSGWSQQGLTASSWSTGGTGVMVPHWFVALASTFLAGTLWSTWPVRFSLRALLTVTTLVAVALGLIVWASRQQ